MITEMGGLGKIMAMVSYHKDLKQLPRPAASQEGAAAGNPSPTAPQFAKYRAK